jgi:hypothetical protein
MHDAGGKGGSVARVSEVQDSLHNCRGVLRILLTRESGTDARNGVSSKGFSRG